MQKRVWTFQYAKEVKAKGSERASWYVGWYDQNGKRHAESCGPGARGSKKAERRKRQLQSELDMGVHQPKGKKKWSEFRKEYDAKIVPSKASRSQEQIKAALDHFERLAKPGRMDTIKTQAIDSFIAARRKERGKNPGSDISPATINKDLRHVKAALRIAFDWEYLTKVPKIRMVREPEKLVRFVTPEHFAVLYHDAAELAELPVIPGVSYEPCQWWKSLIATCYMTGWRIGELLAMRTEDVDLEARTIVMRHSDNKGKREEMVPVHAIVIEHLTPIITDHTFVFRWPHERDKLWVEFGRIQREAGIHLTCREKHEHTPACHVYGFHDFRRAFATANAKLMKPETLQKLMRHKAYKTTLGYVNLAEQVQEAVDQMPIPEPLRKKDAEGDEPVQE